MSHFCRVAGDAAALSNEDELAVIGRGLSQSKMLLFDLA